jgi:etoposide-induced 2.4 mRNA
MTLFYGCSDAEVRANALKSFLLNGISLLSIYVFDLLLQPLVQEPSQPQKWLYRNVGLFYRLLWLLPVVGVSLYLNVGVFAFFLPGREPPTYVAAVVFMQASWCSLIAKRTFTLRHGLAFPYVGATPTTSPNAYIAFLNSLATSAYRAVMIMTCVFLSLALGYVPVVGGVAEIVFFCWVDA